MNFGLGYTPDRAKLPGETPDKEFAHFAAARALSSTPSPSASLAELVLEVLDQGRLGSCTVNAATQAIRMRHVAQGVKNPPLAARLPPYFLSRAVDHNTGVDSGTELRIVCSQLNKYGFAPESIAPYDDGPNTFKQMPSMEYFQAAFDQKAPTEYHRIATSGNAKILDLKRAIDGGFPVIFGCDVSNDFCAGNFSAKSALKPPASKDVAGGHAMLFEGYSGDNFKVLNSWGDNFADEGRVHFSTEYVLQCSDLWIIEHAPIEGEK